MATHRIFDGLEPHMHAQAAALFWDAFKGKLNPVMKPESKALAFFTSVADPTHAIRAEGARGELLGVAGYKTAQGSFMGGGLTEMMAAYGLFGGLWRGLVLSMLERPLKDNVLLMDGIFVTEAARGQGIGTALLLAIKEKAATLECGSVRLDVIDSNPRAKALYEKQGFVAVDTQDIGPLRHFFGFKRATTMVYRVQNRD